jgi:UDP-glucose 4-epimerase
MNKNALITGSSGFIGTSFIKWATGINITEVDLLTSPVETIDFSGIDSVLHLAALVHQMKGAPEEAYFRVNRDLAFDVAKRAKEQGVKQFVLMSTAKVFGESTTGKPAWNEHSECIPCDAYGKSKYEAEMLIRRLEDDSFKVAVVRSPLVYGPGVKANMYSLIKLVDKVPVLPLKGIGNKRSVVYVGNLVALLQRIINLQISGTFIAGDQQPVSTTHLIELIAMGFNKSSYLIKIPDSSVRLATKFMPAIVERLFGSLELDNISTNEKLNFVSPFSTEQGIRETVQWYQKSKN